MTRQFNTLSRRLVVARGGTSPAAVLRTVLGGVIRHLGPRAVGHAKAVARVEGGIVRASTTGTPASVETEAVGMPVARVDRLQVDLLCVFHGIKQKTLEAAWREALSTLTHEGFRVTVLANTPEPGSAKPSPGMARLGIVASLLPSVLMLKPCCLLPTLWSLFGGGVGALSTFTPLEPYRPLFMVAALGLLGSAFYRLYLRPPPFGAVDTRGSVLTSRLLFWAASGVFIGAAISH